jgi:uncharacterized protein (DUF1330 family)
VRPRDSPHARHSHLRFKKGQGCGVEAVVVIEFPGVQQALACHDGAGYQEALKALKGDAVKRDMRIVEGVG